MRSEQADSGDPLAARYLQTMVATEQSCVMPRARSVLAAYYTLAGGTNEPDRDVGAMEQLTKLQGQYLAFIAAYTKLNGRPPAEADIQRYFEVTPPSVHNMIVTLERRGLIRRAPAGRVQLRSRHL